MNSHTLCDHDFLTCRAVTTYPCAHSLICRLGSVSVSWLVKDFPPLPSGIRVNLTSSRCSSNKQVALGFSAQTFSVPMPLGPYWFYVRLVFCSSTFARLVPTKSWQSSEQ